MLVRTWDVQELTEGILGKKWKKKLLSLTEGSSVLRLCDANGKTEVCTHSGLTV